MWNGKRSYMIRATAHDGLVRAFAVDTTAVVVDLQARQGAEPAVTAGVISGGLAVPTPFGTVYSTNITPAPDTGIGRWSEEDFIRAMRRGLRPDGAPRR